MKSEIKRLNEKLATISGTHIRIVILELNRKGVKSVFDIVEFDRKHFCTKVSGKISAPGVEFLRNYMCGDDFSLVEFEAAGAQL